MRPGGGAQRNEILQMLHNAQQVPGCHLPPITDQLIEALRFNRDILHSQKEHYTMGLLL